MAKTLIAIPCMDTMPIEFVSSLIDLNKPDGTKICFKANSLIYDSRNMLSITAINGGFDRILWLDSDMKFPYDALQRLNEDMDAGRDFVSGLYFRRRGTFGPVIMSRVDPPHEENGIPVKSVTDCTEYPQDDIFRVEGCGFGICMTSVDLLKRVWDKFGPPFAPYAWAGEDLSFCYRVKQLGVPVWCDTRIRAGHIGQFIFNEQTYLGLRKEGDQDETES